MYIISGLMTKAGRNDMARQLKLKWESQYFNTRGLNPNEWYSSEKTFSFGARTNGARTLYLSIIGEHAKKRRYNIGQNLVQILTSIPDEIKEIEKAIDEIGLIKHMKEKYNIEVEYIRTSSTTENRREVEVVFIEHDDEGCVGGDDIEKEEDRLNKKWRKM